MKDGLKNYLDASHNIDNQEVSKLIFGIKYYFNQLFETYNRKYGSRLNNN